MGKLISLAAFLVLVSCASESCRELAKKDLPTPQTKGTVKVFKYDGSRQCGMGDLVTLEEMSKELAGIPIVSMKSEHDGKLRTQVCGAETGKANVYEISINDQKSAAKLGFEEWTVPAKAD